MKVPCGERAVRLSDTVCVGEITPGETGQAVQWVSCCSTVQCSTLQYRGPFSTLTLASPVGQCVRHRNGDRAVVSIRC